MSADAVTISREPGRWIIPRGANDIEPFPAPITVALQSIATVHQMVGSEISPKLEPTSEYTIVLTNVSIVFILKGDWQEAFCRVRQIV